MYQVFEYPANEVEVAQDMLKWQLRSGLADMLIRICFFSIPEPEYGYKRYSYKKNMLIFLYFYQIIMLTLK